jgi:hypothetical protein
MGMAQGPVKQRFHATHRRAFTNSGDRLCGGPIPQSARLVGCAHARSPELHAVFSESAAVRVDWIPTMCQRAGLVPAQICCFTLDFALSADNRDKIGTITAR